MQSQSQMRICVASLAAVALAVITAGCTAAPSTPVLAPQPGQTRVVPPARPVPDPGAPVAGQFGGNASVVTAATGFWEVKTETTPTAAALARTLATMADRYPGSAQGQYLRVYLPASARQERTVLDLWWNPSNVTITHGKVSGDARMVPPYSILVDVGVGSGDVITGRNRPQPVHPIVSQVTTQSLGTADEQLLSQLRAATLLP